MNATVTVTTMHSIVHIPSEAGMGKLRTMFPDAEADDLNFVMFSTSGVHGSYTTIEEIEETLTSQPDDFEAAHLTVLIVQPRTVCLHYGNIRVELSDLPFLKKLRASSAKVMTAWATV